VSRLFDDHVHAEVTRTPAAAISWYLIASYAYYEMDCPVLTDALFDRVAGFILNNYDRLTHQHKALLDLETLKCTTFLGTYPTIVINTYHQIRREGIDESGDDMAGKESVLDEHIPEQVVEPDLMGFNMQVNKIPII